MSSEPPRIKTTALTHNEEYCPVAIQNPVTGRRSPNSLESAKIVPVARLRAGLSGRQQHPRNLIEKRVRIEKSLEGRYPISPVLCC